MKRLIFISLLINFPLLVLYSQLYSQWYQQNSGTTAYLLGIKFVDANTGYSVGDSGIVLKTTNGGVNWFRLNSGANGILLRVSFVNAYVGTAVGAGVPYSIIHTTDGGSSWIPQSNPAGGLEDVELIDANTGYAVSSGPGAIIKTTNGGLVWFELPQNQEPTAYWWGLDFVDAYTG